MDPYQCFGGTVRFGCGPGYSVLTYVWGFWSLGVSGCSLVWGVSVVEGGASPASSPAVIEPASGGPSKPWGCLCEVVSNFVVVKFTVRFCVVVPFGVAPWAIPSRDVWEGA